MACFRRAEAVGLVFHPLNVRAAAIQKFASDCGFLPVVLPSNAFRSTSKSNSTSIYNLTSIYKATSLYKTTSISNFDFYLPNTGGVSCRRIS
jgi:hypothetical protein